MDSRWGGGGGGYQQGFQDPVEDDHIGKVFLEAVSPSSVILRLRDLTSLNLSLSCSFPICKMDTIVIPTSVCCEDWKPACHKPRYLLLFTALCKYLDYKKAQLSRKLVILDY